MLKMYSGKFTCNEGGKNGKTYQIVIIKQTNTTCGSRTTDINEYLGM